MGIFDDDEIFSKVSLICFLVMLPKSYTLFLVPLNGRPNDTVPFL